MDNLGLFFYKTYYENNDNFADANEKLYNATLNYKKSGLEGIKGYTCFYMKTAYPGMLVGTGYPHGAGQDDNYIKNGLSFDYTSGQPYIPGSSVKGIIRSYCEKIGYGKDVIDSIFDTGDDVFLDAVVYKPNKEGKMLGEDYITPHKSPIKNPIPLIMLRIMPDVVFEFRFVISEYELEQNGEKIDRVSLFKEALEEMGVGAKTNVGYGKLLPIEKEEADSRKIVENKSNNIPQPLGSNVKPGDIRVGMILSGTVKNIRDFGAFVQIDNSNQMGMVHISQISNSRVDNIRDYLNEGDRVKVKVIEIKADGKIGLSIKQAR